MSVYAKLLKAQQTISGIAKTGHNNHFNYDFFEESEVLRVTRDALNNAGLAFFYSVEEASDREVQTKRGNVEWITDVKMLCTIVDAETGEKVEGRAIGRGQDGQDKGVNKAIVAGLKYWLLKTLMIPTGDDTERNENTNTEGNTRAATKKAAKPKQLTAAQQSAIARGQALWIEAAGLGLEEASNKETAKAMKALAKALDDRDADTVARGIPWLEKQIKEAKQSSEAIPA